MTKPETEKLPELPKAEGFIKRPSAANSYNREEPYFTASQMRAYALAALRAQGGGEADLIQWRYVKADGEVLTPWAECDAAFHDKRKDAEGYEFRFLYVGGATPDAAPDAVSTLRQVAKRNLASLIRTGSDDKELMLKCLEELS